MSNGDGGPPKNVSEVKDESTNQPPTASNRGNESPVDEYVLWSSSEEEGSPSSEGELNATAKSLLDFSSPQFNPFLALKCQSSESISVLEKDAKTYLNLHQYSKAVEVFDKSPRKDVAPLKKITPADIEKKTKEDETKVNPSTSTASLSLSSSVEFPIPGRRFLPHQLPVFRPRREHPNTLTLMDTVTGPLSVLKRVMSEKCRIKIWTRNDKGFRGYLTGFVEAFDKHWNIALRDVDEQFVRKRVIKFPIMGDAIESDKVSEESEACTKSNKEEEVDDFKKKEQAISFLFTRLKNYLRLNDGKKGTGTGSSASAPNINLRNSKRRTSTGNVTSSGMTTKSKTIYVGDMDPLNICRTGLERLNLYDDIHQAEKDPMRRVPITRTKRNSGERPDIIECHQRRLVASAEPSTSSSSSTSSAASRSVPTIHCQQLLLLQPQGKHSITRTSLKKKSLTVFKTPYEDSFGFMVVAHTKKYELVERHVGQVLLMGNDIVFIETSGADKL